MPTKLEVRKFIKPFRITSGRKFRLKDFDPADTGDLNQEDAEKLLRENGERIADLQAKLYAQDQHALLLIFQAMDAAGKDSTIAHVMSGVNPAGCQVFSFKAPSSQELDHDFLWRTSLCLPERGRIGIFNRSYYEEVLIVRVHPQLLAAQKLPPELVTKRIWKERFQDINAFERHLTRSGTVIRKFFLHVSKEEQQRRFLSRLDEPAKNWKFAAGDVAERDRWDDYMDAYEEMIAKTSSKRHPWFVIPADHKWFTRIAVSAAIVDALESLDLEFPKIDAAKRTELAAAREALRDEDEKAPSP